MGICCSWSHFTFKIINNLSKQWNQFNCLAFGFFSYAHYFLINKRLVSATRTYKKREHAYSVWYSMKLVVFTKFMITKCLWLKYILTGTTLIYLTFLHRITLLKIKVNYFFILLCLISILFTIILSNFGFSHLVKIDFWIGKIRPSKTLSKGG